MKRNYKFFIVLTILIVTIAMPALAQRTGSASGSSTSSAPSKPVLTVNCNVRNALVEISTLYYKDGPVATGSAPYSAQLDKNTYIVTVTAPGYEEQKQTINFSNSTTLNFNLGQQQQQVQKVQLQIRSNVRNAEVIITGQSIGGQFVGSAPFSAQLEKGRYSVTVSSSGYLTQTKDVTLNSSQNLNFNLDPLTYNLTVTSNVNNAKVFIKGGDINGQITGNTELTTVLPPGTYRIKVNAAHYFAEEKTIQFNGTSTVDFQLRGRTARLEVIIPNDILDYSKSNPANRISIFDNGLEVDGTSMELSPGQHTIRITSGGMASQQTINVKAGESYRIELDFGFMLIKQ